MLQIKYTKTDVGKFLSFKEPVVNISGAVVRTIVSQLVNPALIAQRQPEIILK